MIGLLCFVVAVLASPIKAKIRLEAENAALRHQLVVLRRQLKGRARLTNDDRWFFVQLYRWFPSILPALMIIRPETLVRWHRAGFRRYWRWQSRRRGGRPPIEAELRALIRQMSTENLLWGAPRIHGELLKLGFEVAQSSVAKYMVKRRGLPSQGWRTFLRNHAPEIAAMDLFVVPTIGFDLLYAFVIVRLDRRDLVWINVTTNPTAEWVARQITEAFPWDMAPRYMIRDRDRIYGIVVTRRLRAMGIRDKPTAPASPWQNGFAERLIGSIRRECLDHVIVWGEPHLRRILRSYANYYDNMRTHRSLNKDAPISRSIQRIGIISSRPILGGLHHHKGEKPRVVANLDVDNRRTMEAEITSRAVEFIKRNASAGKPFFAYVPFSLVHMPTLPNLEFAGKTGNGDWADCLAEMDYRTGQILDAIKQAGIDDNTLVVFTSDNGPEATNPWEGDSGPWRGTYFTAMEASLRTPFIIRWPGKVPAGRVNNEIVHIVDMFTTLARVGGATIPKDRPIDGVDQLDFFLGKQDASNREGFPAYVADRLTAVKWHNWKAHFIWQENMYASPQTLPLPKVINLLTDRKEERDVGAYNSWVADPVVKIVGEFEASLKKYRP